MFNINFTEYSAHKTCGFNNCHFIGYFYNSKGEIFRNENAISYFLNLHKENNIAEINKLSGIYSILIIENQELIVYTDISNFFPIFFFQNNGVWNISNDWCYLTNIKGGINFNSEQETSFLNVGFTLRNSTLDKDILKTKAGQVAKITNQSITFTNIYSFLPNKIQGKNFNENIGLGEQAFHKAGSRLIKFLDGRTALLPLSGGFDSRLILSILKQNNYKKVICFTYGKQTKEVEISRKAAEICGYDWHFVDYKKINYHNFVYDTEFLDYAFSYGNGYSMPYLQEYFALKYLTENSIVPENSVFLPGHSGDFLGGSYVNKTVKIKNNKIDLAKHLEEKYFNFKKKKRKEKNKIKDLLRKDFLNSEYNTIRLQQYCPCVEDWDLKEKLSKFIARSSFVFTYFGFEHIYFFWDMELVEFWKNQAYQFRESKVLYDEIVCQKFFKPLKIYFDKQELKVSSKQFLFQQIKDFVRYFFPWKYTLSRMIKSDWINYSAFTVEMEKELEKKGFKKIKHFKVFNARICRWYAEKLKES